MNFALSDEQRLIGDTLGELLTAADVPTAVRAWADGDRAAGDALWDQLAAFGVTALVHDEQHGGIGADAGHLVAAFERLGRHAVPGPLVESAVAAPILLAAAVAAGGGDDPEAARGARPGPARAGGAGDERASVGDASPAAALLDALADGSRRATVVRSPVVPLALDADAVDALLVVGPSRLVLHPPSAAGPRNQSVDPARRLFVAPSGDGTVLLSGDAAAAAAERATLLATLATAAQLVGAGRQLLEATRAYTLQRRQFGREIGEFQAVKHHLADAAIALEFAWPLVLGAAVAVDASGPTETGSAAAVDAVRDVSAAKLRAGVAADRVARIALQVHGAIGYTSEYDLGLWLKKVRALVGAWGTPAHHRRIVATRLGLAGEEPVAVGA